LSTTHSINKGDISTWFKRGHLYFGLTIQRFVIDNPKPFIVRIGQQGRGKDGMQYELKRPLTTITTKAEHCLVEPFLLKLQNGEFGRSVDDPVPTLTTRSKVGEVRAFLIQYYGSSTGHKLTDPLYTVTSKDRFGLVTVHGVLYQIVDIGMRMLQPHELYAAQGFPKNYIFTHDSKGKRITKTQQVAKCGNSVCPALSQALVTANMSIEQKAVA
jgi:DNA (cytosine-5)-methyltransferase 1